MYINNFYSKLTKNYIIFVLLKMCHFKKFTRKMGSTKMILKSKLFSNIQIRVYKKKKLNKQMK